MLSATGQQQDLFPWVKQVSVPRLSHPRASHPAFRHKRQKPIYGNERFLFLEFHVLIQHDLSAAL